MNNLPKIDLVHETTADQGQIAQLIEAEAKHRGDVLTKDQDGRIRHERGEIVDGQAYILTGNPKNPKPVAVAKAKLTKVDGRVSMVTFYR